MGHTMTVEWHGYDDVPTYTAKCTEPAEALCRADWDCDCEEFAAHGVDEHGPWHQLTNGYMTDEDRKADTPPRHYGTHGGECGYVLSLAHNDDIAEAGFGPTTFHVDIQFDGEEITWSPS